MTSLGQVRKHMEIIGADGVHIGTVDAVEGRRIKMIRADSGSHSHHHHFLSAGLIAGVEGNKVRLSANGDSAVLLEEEDGGEPITDKSIWNWRTLGVGAAVVGVAAAVAAGAGLRSRRRRGEDA